jgi:O-antigen ligase/tetratricopeptide (TPR) repeat protein
MNTHSRKPSIIKSIITIVMIGVPVWFLGGNLPPVRSIAMLATIVASLFVIASALFRKDKEALRQLPFALWISVPLILGTIYAALQAYSADWNPIASSYPPATRLRLCELLLGIATFLLFSRLLIRPSQTSWFFGVVMVTGAAVAAFGLIQHAGWNGKLYWFYELIYGGQPFGPFVNGNNAGGFLLMCFAASNFFIASRIFRGSTIESNGVSRRKSRGIVKELTDFIVNALAQLDNRRLYVCGAMILIAAGIATSLSRGALVALAVSTITGWMLLFSNKRMVIALSTAVLLLGVAIALYTEGNSSALRPTTVGESLQSMTDVTKASSNRLAHWSVAWRMVQDHWLTGTGLGTYSISYPSYQQAHLTKIFLHAENQYLEALAEMGIFGLAMLLIAIGFFLRVTLQLIQETDAFSRAVGVSGLMALVSQMVAGALDFGLYQPANTILMAGMMGAVVGRKTWIEQTRPKDAVQAPAWGHVANQLIFACVLLATGWATWEYSAVDAQEKAARFIARFQPLRDAVRIKEMETLVGHSLRVRPDDAKNHLAMSQLKTLRYRIDASYELIKAAEEQREQLENAASESGDGTDASSTTTDAPESQSVTQMLREQLPDLSPVDQDAGLNVDIEDIAGDLIEPSTESQNQQPDAEEPSDAQTPAGESDSSTVSQVARSEPITIEQVWGSTSLNNLHRLTRAAQKFNPELFDEIVNSAPVKDHLSVAFEHAKKANELLPDEADLLMHVAHLAHLFDKDFSEEARITRAIERRPYGSGSLFTGGLLSLQSFRYDQGCGYWKRCLELTRTYDPQIIDFCRRELTVDQFLNKTLPEDPELLIRLARNYFRQPEDYVLKKIILDHTARVVAKSDLETTDKFHWQGIAAFEGLKFDEAIECFNKVLEARSDEVSTRVMLARALIAKKQYLEATEELKVCQLYSDCPIGLVQRLLNVANRNQARFLRNLKRKK